MVKGARMPLLSLLHRRERLVPPLSHSSCPSHKCFAEFFMSIQSPPTHAIRLYSCSHMNAVIDAMTATTITAAAEPTAPTQIDRARNHCSRIKGRNSADHKSRFFWRIGPPPADNAHRDLNMPPVIPANFPHWADTVNGWGEKMLGQCTRGPHRTYVMRIVFSFSSCLPRLLPAVSTHPADDLILGHLLDADAFMKREL
jgi:hypothetical protein